jgi:phosphatidylinositol alpha-1,6-mannosyltransferase
MSTQNIVLLKGTNSVGANSARVLIALEQHFLAGEDGHIYTSDPPNYAFWRRYLSVFDEVVVLARVGQARDQMPQEQRADGSAVAFWRLPDYTGPAEYLRDLIQLRCEVRKAVSNAHAYILRLPGAIGNLAADEIRRQGKRYAVEIVGDSWDVFSPGSFRSPLRPFYRRLMTSRLRRNCRQAVAVSYVTQSTLQARYPACNGAYVCGVSDVRLGNYIADVKTIENRKQRVTEVGEGLCRPVRLGFVGSLETHYKGADTLLKAVSLSQQQGLHVEAHLLGDGRLRPEFETMAQELGVWPHVYFHGHVPAGKAVFEFLDSIDIFVMPSRVEGLPRAMLEAMARGCPCIGSAVGGIPELLATEALIQPADEIQLSEAINRFASDGDLMLRMIEHNINVAQSFRPEALEEAHRGFLNEVRARCSSPTRLNAPESCVSQL